MAYIAGRDPFSRYTRTPSHFGRKARTVTPSDGTDLTQYARLLVTAGGTLAVVPVDQDDDTAVSLGTVAAGFIPPFEVRRVYSTGTTATVVTIDP